MADGSVVFSISADDKEAQKKLNQLHKDIEKTTKSLYENTGKQSAIAKDLSEARAEAEKTAAEIERTRELIDEGKQFTGTGMNVSAVDRQRVLDVISEQEARETELNNLLTTQKATVADLEQKHQDITEKIQTQTAQLEQQQAEAGAIERTFAEASSNTLPQLKGAVEDVSKSIRKGVRNILKWGFGIRSAFILMRRLRSAIKEGINTFAEYDEETKNSINGLKTALASLKVSWGAAFAPIVNAVAPLLERLINLLITAANYVQMFFAVLNGQGFYKKAIANNEALAKSYGGAGGAAKDAQKQIMGFDEINKLEDMQSGGGGGGGSDSALSVEEAEVNTTFANVIQQIKDNLAAVEFITGTALLALGAILTFSGTNIPLGLGLMAAGAVTLAHAVKEDWSSLNPKVSSAVSEIATLLGGALLTLGAILAFSGANVPLGIGMMLAGAISVGAVALNWDNLPDEVQGVVSKILIGLGAALLAVGAILAFSGANVPLGIGLILAGAVSLGSAIGLNWEAVTNFIKKDISDILVVLGAALLAIGAVLVFSGANIPLGIGMMVAGGFALATAVGLNWDYIVEKVQGVKDRLSEIINRFIDKVNEMREKIASAKDAVVQKFTEIKDGITEKITAAKDKVREIIDRIKGLFEGLHIQLPHIALPHIQVSWEDVSQSSIARLLGITALPHFALNWYARGGIVDGATLFGAGEDGAEAVVPLERHTEWITMVADTLIDRLTSSGRIQDIVSQIDLPALINGQIVPPRALTGGGILTDADIDKLVSGITQAFTGGDAGDQSIKLYLDGKQIAETVTKHQRRMERGFA